MSWWNTTIPLWHVMGIISVYVIYKELVKFAFKSIIKAIRRRNAKPAVLAPPPHPEP